MHGRQKNNNSKLKQAIDEVKEARNEQSRRLLYLNVVQAIITMRMLLQKLKKIY